MRKTFFFLTICALLLSACGNNTAPVAPASGGAAKAIEGYLTALITKKLDQVKNASCAAWEKEAKIDFDSFQAVTSKLEGMACKDGGADGKFTVVNCIGKIVVTYQNENQTLNLADKAYLAVQEGGAWKMCGYK